MHNILTEFQYICVSSINMPHTHYIADKYAQFLLINEETCFLNEHTLAIQNFLDTLIFYE